MKNFKRFKRIGNLALILSLMLTTAPDTFARHSTKHSVILGGGASHDVPSPFQYQKNKYELADGEVYSLFGSITLLPSLSSDPRRQKAYFAVNLDDHPYLANINRVKSPLYLIEDAPENWIKWNGRSITLLCMAHGRILFTTQGPHYAIQLEPIEATESCLLNPSMSSD
jgi:hypothetical protein